MTDPIEILHPIRRTPDEVNGEDDLRASFASGRQLRIKYGADCTGPDLHLGHAVNLWSMRHFQDHAHRVVFLLGDTITRIGDLTGKSATRPLFAPTKIHANAAASLKQVGLVLDAYPELFDRSRALTPKSTTTRKPLPRLGFSPAVSWFTARASQSSGPCPTTGRPRFSCLARRLH